MPIVQNPIGSGGGGGLSSTTTHLTAAQIINLGNVPVELIPAPGAGNIIVVFGAAMAFEFGTIAYSPSGSDILFAAYATDLLIGLTANVTGLITSANSAFQFGAADQTGLVNILPGDDNQAVVLTGDATYPAGAIATSSLAAGGSGYAIGDTGTIQTGNDDATYQVLTIGALGAVATYAITFGGTLYQPQTNQPTATGGAQPGVGINFAVNILTVTPGDGTLKVVTYYQIVPVP
jgi:hypothetical protein